MKGKDFKFLKFILECNIDKGNKEQILPGKGKLM